MLDATSGRSRLIALVAATLALALAGVAVVIMATRGGDHPAATGPAMRDQRVAAASVARLTAGQVEAVVEAGQRVGVRIEDDALAGELGLARGDVITSLSGRPTFDPSDVMLATGGLDRLGATVIYVELRHDARPVVVRWQLDGDLHAARRDQLRPPDQPPRPTRLPVVDPAGGAMPRAPADDAAFTAAVDAIEEVDDQHYRLPRATVDTILANPMIAARGARLVPSIKNGLPDGLKLYAIRPSSVYARLGFKNGDSVQFVNGHAIDSADRALEVYTQIRTADQVVVELTRRGMPVTLTFTVTP